MLSRCPTTESWPHTFLEIFKSAIPISVPLHTLCDPRISEYTQIFQFFAGPWLESAHGIYLFAYALFPHFFSWPMIKKVTPWSCQVSSRAPKEARNILSMLQEKRLRFPLLRNAPAAQPALAPVRLTSWSADAHFLLWFLSPPQSFIPFSSL